ncbi:MAG: serine hydrolase domain-containing protein [Bacteroidota bacterium]
MNRLFLLSLSLILALPCSCQESRTTLSSATDVDSLFYEHISNQNIIGAAAGYSVFGKTVWQAVDGFSNKESNTPFQKDTKVRMASIAKPMTAIAIMQLVERNLVELDIPIQTYIPDYPKQSKTQITVRHLLSHTSGIDGYKNTKEAETQVNYPTLSDAVEIFKNRPLLFEPGTGYNYTTYGYTLLGLIIEKVTGLTFEVYMKKYIWDSAKMTSTGIDRYGIDEGNSSRLYSRTKKGKTVEGKENNLSNRVPGGGFFTTVEDMLKFGSAVINNTLIKSETLSLMRKRHSVNTNSRYGLGWFLYSQAPDEGKIIGHSGAQMGCSSQLLIFPEKGIVCIVLANTSRTEVTGFAIDLLKIAAKQELAHTE